MGFRFFERLAWFRWAIACTVMIAIAYLITVCTFSRWYAPLAVLEEGDGCVSIYWGGDRGMRNDAVYNAGDWPLLPDANFAGAEAPRYEFYGPGDIFSPEWGDVYRHNNRLGIRFPRYDPSPSGPGSLIVPLPPFLVLSGALSVYGLWRRRRRSGRGFPMLPPPRPPT